MADTIMQDTVMRDADMQEVDMQDTVMQDTVVPGPIRKIANMKKIREDGMKRCTHKCFWGPTEKFHLLHLYTMHHNDILRDKMGKFDYGHGVIAGLARDMTAESVKHHPGGSLHASDPWCVRTYSELSIRSKLRKCLVEEEELAVDLEAELNTHYGIVSEAAARQAALEKSSAEETAKRLKQEKRNILREKKTQEKTPRLREEHIRDSNEGLRLAFTKIKKPYITDKTDAWPTLTSIS
ncbi:hypothetical protein BHYA_0383g00060 [Botrytis hyacinthi]|uniref:Uncharacterized protein n=1 Tax=Botrytis hyacinthi TaxID=278943 RepID=A0A4Z1G4I8_9HELO|nr:hypothetical protein BHYA_0383g00060 [Botrytis hyacinthi]